MDSPGFQVFSRCRVVTFCVCLPRNFQESRWILGNIDTRFLFENKMPGPHESPDQLESYNGLGNHVSGGGWINPPSGIRSSFGISKCSKFSNSQRYIDSATFFSSLIKKNTYHLKPQFVASWDAVITCVRWCAGGVASADYKVFSSLPQHLPGGQLTPGKLLRFSGNGTSLPIHVIIYHDMFSFTCTNIYINNVCMELHQIWPSRRPWLRT